jgi:hypothetical protein
MQPVSIAVYVVLAAFVGWLGRERAIGFWGFFVLALLLTPLLIALAIVITIPKATHRQSPASDQTSQPKDRARR